MTGRKRKAEEMLKNDEPTKSSSEEEDDDEEDDDEEEEKEIELLVNQRDKRVTAGNRMGLVMESAAQEDDFYKSAYGGGFNEDDTDDIFESPVHSDVDEVDSDFDRPEIEDEPISDQDDPDKPKRKQRPFKEPVRGDKDALKKKHRWVVARMGGAAVPANSVDDLTQMQRLKEAQETEKLNKESLKKYEEFELEKKRKREKATDKKSVPHPLIALRDSENTGKVVVYPSCKEMTIAKKKANSVCAVTGRPAKYRDPITDLPYASPFAFKVIRDKYHKYLKTLKNNSEAAEYMTHFA